MDLVFKAKIYELEAIDFLNNNAPMLYQGKNNGFYWALHEACNDRTNICFTDIVKIKIERYFNGLGYEEKAGINTHVTGDDREFELLSNYLESEKVFDLKRPIQKSYFIRLIIKYGIFKLKGMEKIYMETNTENCLDDSMRFNLSVEVSEMLFQNNERDKKVIDEIFKMMRNRR